jgi:hypothetical protein
METINKIWKSTPKQCKELGVPDMDTCRIGNRVAKEIAKRCLAGDEQTFEINGISRQSKNPEAFKAFLDLSFGDIWDVETRGECKGGFWLTHDPKGDRIIVQYDE